MVQVHFGIASYITYTDKYRRITMNAVSRIEIARVERTEEKLASVPAHH